MIQTPKVAHRTVKVHDLNVFYREAGPNDVPAVLLLHGFPRKEPKSKEKRDALRKFLTYDATQWQYTHGVKNPELVSPDGPAHDQFLLDRQGNDEIQLDLFLSYGSNPPLYPAWQEYFRTHQPPVLLAWGKDDQIFPAAGAEPYKRDLKTLEYHLLDAGHFALETNGDEIAKLMREFLGKHVTKK